MSTKKYFIFSDFVKVSNDLLLQFKNKFNLNDEDTLKLNKLLPYNYLHDKIDFDLLKKCEYNYQFIKTPLNPGMFIIYTKKNNFKLLSGFIVNINKFNQDQIIQVKANNKKIYNIYRFDHLIFYKDIVKINKNDKFIFSLFDKFCD